ncbi:lytic transglycosylase domain-containing protein [Nitrosovibrio tenuis]|nr:lytic transglycosylase domain-containing protein [Nitrosovibrio tenuis]
MIKKPVLHPLILGVLLACGLAQPVHAEIYSFIDENGVTHFSNVPTDRRYVPLTGSASDRSAGYQFITRPRIRRPEPAVKVQYGSIIDTIARTYALESALLHAVISAESGYNSAAVSKKGAAGLMQLMPETAQRYGVTDRFDPVQNLHGGARYLSDLLRMFDGNLSLALAGYNAGENSVVKHGYQIPPYVETRTYVPKVLNLYRRYQLSKLPQTKRGA